MKFFKHSSVKQMMFFIALLLSSCGFAQDDKMPPFSWETIPVYIHFGDVDALTDEEVEFVASHTGFTCLEKGHGINKHGSTEKGIEADVKRMKQINPKLKNLYYWNTFLDYSLYDAHNVYQQHPEWWLKTKNGELDKKNGDLMRYDLSNPEVREWWTEEAKRAVVDGACDGVFMDAFPQVASLANIDLWGQQKFDDIQRGLKEIIVLTKQKLGDEAIIMYNGIRNTDHLKFGMGYLELCDAVTIEHFGVLQSASKENMLLDIENATTAGKMGKIVVFKGWPSFLWMDEKVKKSTYKELLEEAQQDITFPLACFLIAAQEYSYFCYSWGYRQNGGMLDWYEEFDQPLGKPMGDYVKNGWELSREFAHCNVWVNLASRQARITYKE